MWEILYLARAEKALRKLDQQTARRIRDGLNRLAQLDDPTTPCKALSGPLTGLWRYRVGDSGSSSTSTAGTSPSSPSTSATAPKSTANQLADESCREWPSFAP